MKISKKTFGVLSYGKKVHLYTLKAGELSLCISTLGAAWTSLKVPSAERGVDDILLGYSSFDGYVQNDCFGSTLGRFANRIGRGRFSLKGKEYALFKNDGEHSLDGGRLGFSRQIWKAEAYEERDGVFVRFELKSPDGDEGYPGNLKAAVSYGLTKSNELVADYQARVDAPCPLNVTNRAFFNLAGEGRGINILSTELRLNSSLYVDTDTSLIPTGKLKTVENTPFDFRRQKPIGKSLAAPGEAGIGAYDHCFVIDGEAGDLKPFAEVFEPSTGRSIRAFTTQPSVHFCSLGNRNPVRGKLGSTYGKHDGFCLQTQHFPDSPNRPEFPSAVFGPERDYHEKSVFAFAW